MTAVLLLFLPTCSSACFKPSRSCCRSRLPPGSLSRPPPGTSNALNPSCCWCLARNAGRGPSAGPYSVSQSLQTDRSHSTGAAARLARPWAAVRPLACAVDCAAPAVCCWSVRGQRGELSWFWDRKLMLREHYRPGTLLFDHAAPTARFASATTCLLAAHGSTYPGSNTTLHNMDAYLCL